MKLFAKFLVAAPLLFAFTAASAEIPRKDWSETCTDAKIEGGVLHANCKPISGDSKPAQINTDDFIGNIDGTLMFAGTSSGEIPRKDWSETCTDAKIEGGVLHANCKSISGDSKPAQINTDNFIGNIDGVLKVDM